VIVHTESFFLQLDIRNNICCCFYLFVKFNIETKEKETTMMLVSSRRGNLFLLVVLLVTSILGYANAQDGFQSTDLTQAEANYGFSSSFSSFAAGTVVYYVNENGSTFQLINVSRNFPAGSGAVQLFAAPDLGIGRSPGNAVSVGAPNGAAWGVSTQRQLGFGSGNIPYWENFVSGSWNEVSGGVRSISIGGPQGSVWATDNNGRVWTRNFASPTSPGVGWSQVVSFSTLLSLVDIGGPFGDVWALGILSAFGNFNVYYRRGITSSNRTGSGWNLISSNFLLDISVGGGFAGGSILELPIVYGCGATGTVYRRDGISQNNRSGSTWTPLTVSPRMQKVSVNGDGSVLWGVSTERVFGSNGSGFKIFYYPLADFSTQRWIPISGAAIDISAF